MKNILKKFMRVIRFKDIINFIKIKSITLGLKIIKLQAQFFKSTVLSIKTNIDNGNDNSYIKSKNWIVAVISNIYIFIAIQLLSAMPILISIFCFIVGYFAIHISTIKYKVMIATKMKSLYEQHDADLTLIKHYQHVFKYVHYIVATIFVAISTILWLYMSNIVITIIMTVFLIFASMNIVFPVAHLLTRNALKIVEKNEKD